MKLERKKTTIAEQDPFRKLFMKEGICYHSSGVLHKRPGVPQSRGRPADSKKKSKRATFAESDEESSLADHNEEDKKPW